MKLANISIIIVTYNNERTIKKCLEAIKRQDYPRNQIEYLNIDGGSSDKTLSILKSGGFKSIKSPIKRNAEAQRAVGIKAAKHNLIVSIDADNYLPNSNWLQQMVKPFIEDPNIIHANTMHYTYLAKDSLYNRYCSLFGLLDPIVYYVGNPDRMPQFIKKWKKGKVLKETDNHYLVEFSKKNLPTVGCNGVVYRKDILLKYAKSDPSQFLHIDVFVDLIERGYNRFAIVKNDIIHDTAVDLSMLLKKRIAFLTNYYLKAGGAGPKRRYYIYNPKNFKDNMRLFLFILYSITLIKPILDSFRGFLSVRDWAWFLHPFVCLVYFYAYSAATTRHLIKKIIKI